jgi:hypothetical protein
MASGFGHHKRQRRTTMDANVIIDDEKALDSKIAYAAMVAADTLLSELRDNEIRLLARPALMNRLERTLRELQKQEPAAMSISDHDDATHIRDVILHAVGNTGKADMNMDELLEGALTAVAMLAVNGMAADSSSDDLRQYAEGLGGLLVEHMMAAYRLRDHLPAQLATQGIGPVIMAEAQGPVTATGPTRFRRSCA